MSVESFGDRVRRLRKAKGYTQEELGVAAGLGGGTVSRWERGAEEKPTRTAIGAVARVLGVSADYLVTGQEDAPGAPLEVDAAVEKVEAAMAFLAAAFDEWRVALAIATGQAPGIVEPGVEGGALGKSLPRSREARADAHHAQVAQHKAARRRRPGTE